jgi:hypothetical protein
MSFSPDAKPEAWVAVGPDLFLDTLAPLRYEHGRWGDAMLVPGDAREIQRIARDFRNRRARLLVVEDPTQPSVRPRYDSPFLERAGGSDVLLGWVRIDRAALATYARRASALLRRRDDAPQTVVLLGPRGRRYLDLLDELERTAKSARGLTVFRWSAERIRRAPMVDGLRLGAAAILYTGHGSVGG